MGSYAGFHSAVTVSAFGAAGEYCNVAYNSGTEDGDAHASVQCYDSHGVPAPSVFTIAYALDIPFIC